MATADKSVFSTLGISLLAVEEENRTALGLFDLCGFLHNEDIPEELLRLHYDGEQYSPLTSVRVWELRLLTCLYILVDRYNSCTR